MNIMLIIVGVVFLVSIIMGYRKGFVNLLASLAGTIAAVLLASLLSPMLSGVILKTFPLEKTMQKACVEWLIPEDDNENETSIEEVDESKEAQMSVIQNSKLPEALREKLLENNNNAIYQVLGVNKFSEYVGSFMAKLIANIISFIILWIVASICMRLLVKSLKFINKIPLVGTVNKVAGGALGGVNALLIVWIAFLIITMLYNTEIGGTLLKNINSNSILKTLYENNPLMNALMKFLS